MAHDKSIFSYNALSSFITDSDDEDLKKIDDPTVSEKFNAYSHSQYKDEIISLIKKIITVSLGTLKIIDLMKKENVYE